LTLSGPLGSLAKMCLGLSTWHSTKCVLIWKVSATPSGRSVYRLVPSTPRTSGNGSGFLATATSTANQLCPSMQKHPGCRALYPTITAHRGGYNQGGGNGRTGKIRPTLDMMAARNLWPTPDSYPRGGPQNVEKRKAGGHSVSLQDAVHTFPTPTANRRDGLQSHGKNIVSGSLNPTWVEWLMGYPSGWTDLGRSVMPLSHTSLRSLDE
jgi:DNA (cytosine-5)-methyltransferase 1